MKGGFHPIDVLPDGWGRLLMDRKLRDLGIRPGREAGVRDYGGSERNAGVG